MEIKFGNWKIRNHTWTKTTGSSFAQTRNVFFSYLTQLALLPFLHVFSQLGFSSFLSPLHNHQKNEKNLSLCPSSLLLLQAISVSRPIWEPNSSPINPLWLPQKQLTSEAVRKRKKRRKKEKKENASIRGGLQNVLKQLCIYTHKKKGIMGSCFMP